MPRTTPGNETVVRNARPTRARNHATADWFIGKLCSHLSEDWFVVDYVVSPGVSAVGSEVCSLLVG